MLSGILKHNISRADPNDNPENQPIVLDYFRIAIDIQEGSEELENFNFTILERSSEEPNSILPTDTLDEIVQMYWDDHNLDLIDMAVPVGLDECVQNIQETLHAVNSVFESMKVKTSFEKSYTDCWEKRRLKISLIEMLDWRILVRDVFLSHRVDHNKWRNKNKLSIMREYSHLNSYFFF